MGQQTLSEMADLVSIQTQQPDATSKGIIKKFLRKRHSEVISRRNWIGREKMILITNDSVSDYTDHLIEEGGT